MEFHLIDGTLNHANTEEIETLTQPSTLTTTNYGTVNLTAVMPAIPSQTLKLEVVTSLTLPHIHDGQTEPPQREIIEQTLPTLSFPFFDTSQLQPINLSISLPETRLSQVILPEVQGAYSAEGQSSSHHTHPVSLSRIRLRTARQQTLSRIGIHSYSSEKRLLAAVRNNDVCTVIRLLQDGVSPNVSDSKQRTPLHIAASQGLDHIVSSLTAMRADPNKLDILGNTPLHLAICRGDTRIVRILVGSGADIHIKDRVGRTPLDIVQSRLNMRRQDRNISTDRLIGECRMIVDILKIHAARLPYQESSQVDALCEMMADVSTREQVDELADNMLNQMSNLSLAHQTEMKVFS